MCRILSLDCLPTISTHSPFYLCSLYYGVGNLGNFIPENLSKQGSILDSAKPAEDITLPSEASGFPTLQGFSQEALTS